MQVDAETVERVAREFHATYERLAPDHGYETRRESAVPWEQVPERNRRLMLAVVEDLLKRRVIQAVKRKDRGPVASRGERRSMLWVAICGFGHARDRYDQARTVKGVEALDVFIPLTEALWWAVSIDDAFEDLEPKEYPRRRGRDADAGVLQGCRFARNRMGHQHALTIRSTSGDLVFPMTFPLATDSDFTWRPVEELPPADRQGPAHDADKAAYCMHLEGKPARDALKVLYRWIWESWAWLLERDGQGYRGRREGGPPPSSTDTGVQQSG